MIFLIFLSIFFLTNADINIFYADDVDYTYSEEEGEKIGGLPATVGMIKKLKSKYPNQLFLILGSEEEEKEKYDEVLGKAKVSATLINNSSLNKPNYSIPTVGCNLHYTNSKAKPFVGYKNIYLDTFKISIVGLTNNISNEKYEIKNSLEDLKRTLDLLDKTYSPDIYIVISSLEDKDLFDTLKKRKNLVLIDRAKRENISEIQKHSMVAKKVEKGELGIFSLKTTNESITDYSNITTKIKIKSKEERKEEANKEEQMKAKEKKEGKKATKQDREDILKNLENSSVEEDKTLKEFINSI